jgi:hypothetical protein
MQTQLPPFKEQEDKIIQAYFKDEIKPFDAKFCFCGTLAPNTTWKYKTSRIGKHVYTEIEYRRMEGALFSQFPGVLYKDLGIISFPGNYRMGSELYIFDNKERFEDLLFTGMVAALEVLKSIHIEHGQQIEEPILLTKRVLTT